MTSKRKNKNKNKHRSGSVNSSGSSSASYTQSAVSEIVGTGNIHPSPIIATLSKLTSADFVLAHTSTPSNPDLATKVNSNHEIDTSNIPVISQHDMDLIDVDVDEGKSEHSHSCIDNNSLLTALQSQNDRNFQNMHQRIDTTITGAISQLKSELKLEFKSALDKHRKDLVSLKQTTTEQISRIDLKVSSNLSEMNVRVNSLSDKMTELHNVLSNTNLGNIDQSLTENADSVKLLTSQLSSLKGKIDSCESQQTELTKSVKFVSTQYEEIKTLLKDNETKTYYLEARVDNNEIRHTRLNTKVTSLETQHTISDSKHRKFNLIFDGIAEGANEDAKGIITNLFNNSNGLAAASTVDTAYRLGRPSANYIRPILVAFHSIAAKDNVLRNASKLKQATNSPNLWINRDHPDLTRKQSANARKCYNLMKLNKHKCSLSGTSITYNGKIYHYKDLNKLPTGLCLEDTRMIECNDGKGICFQSELSFLSNFHSVPLYYKNKHFEHSEQAFQWTKAITCNDLDKAREIMALENPQAIKALGEEVTQTEQWALAELNVLRAITYLKFTQNRSLGERLRNCPFEDFYECTTSTYWGTGLKLPSNSREIDTSKFVGENHFGLILKEVKAKLILDAQRHASPHASTQTPHS